MAIFLDVSRLVWRAWNRKLPTGIDRTCLAYASHYYERSQAVIQAGGSTRVLSVQATRALYDVVLGQGAGASRPKLLSLLRLCLGGPSNRSLLGRFYFNVGHTGLDKAVHVAWLRRTGVRPIYFIHDLIPIHYPEYCRPSEPEKHRRRVEALLRHGVGMVGNSRHTLDDIARFAEQQSFSTPPALLAPLGLANPPRSSTAVAEAALPDRPYFVVLGTIEARKNHLLLLNVWAELARRLGSACPMLVIIGQRGWECEQAIDLLDRCEAIRGHVFELSSCNDATLAAYMRGARALLFPSFAEGYGLPLVEALAAGTPVIASDLPVFRELAGSIPDYLSPIDGMGWMNAIEDYENPGSPRRSAQLERLRGWEPPSWSAHFEKVDEWLNQISQIPVSVPASVD